MLPNFPDKLLKERFIHEERYITVYDQFRPNYDHVTLTPKFYSKHEGCISEPNTEHYEKLAAKYRLPKDKQMWPETSNQWYGWFITPFAKENRNDERLYFPLKTSEMTKHVLKMFQDRASRRK